MDFTTEALRSQRWFLFFIRSGDDDQIKDQSAEGRWDILLGLAQKKTSLCTSDKKQIVISGLVGNTLYSMSQNRYIEVNEKSYFKICQF